MKGRPIGGMIFLGGVAVIAALAAYKFVLYPIVCFVKAGCGAASW